MGRIRYVVSVLALTLTLVVFPAVARGSTAKAAVSVYAAGLTNPRGFTWGEDGTLYVASAGDAGVNGEITGDTGMPAVATVLAEFVADNSGAVVRIEDGCPVTVADGLPSSSFTPANQV